MTDEIEIEAFERVDNTQLEHSIFGDFAIHECIGTGGVAIVYRAEFLEGPLKGREAALKMLLPQFFEDELLNDLFVSEADITRYMDHPGVVRVLDTGYLGGEFYIASEYVPGCTLRQLLKHSLQLPIGISCLIALSVAEALIYVHAKTGPNGTPLEAVHCDVTPENIFLGVEGTIKLGDFGSTYAAAFGTPLPSKLFVGKAAYIPAERIRGQPPTCATDVFALGAVLYEMIVGDCAFRGNSTEAVFEAILEGRYESLLTYEPETPVELTEVIETALAPTESQASSVWAKLHGLLGRVPKIRFSTVEAFHGALMSGYAPDELAKDALAAIVQTLPRRKGPPPAPLDAQDE